MEDSALKLKIPLESCRWLITFEGVYDAVAYSRPEGHSLWLANGVPAT